MSLKLLGILDRFLHWSIDRYINRTLPGWGFLQVQQHRVCTAYEDRYDRATGRTYALVVPRVHIRQTYGRIENSVTVMADWEARCDCGHTLGTSDQIGAMEWALGHLSLGRHG